MTDAKRIPVEARCSDTRLVNWQTRQCSRAGKHKEEGKLWCAQHLPSAIKARRDLRNVAWQAKWDEEKRKAADGKRAAAHAATCVAAHDALVAACEAAVAAIDGVLLHTGSASEGEIEALEKLRSALALARAKK